MIWCCNHGNLALALERPKGGQDPFPLFGMRDKDLVDALPLTNARGARRKSPKFKLVDINFLEKIFSRPHVALSRKNSMKTLFLIKDNFSSVYSFHIVYASNSALINCPIVT